jgi:hypothetical protein
VDSITVDVRFDDGILGGRRGSVTIPIWGQKKCQIADVGAGHDRKHSYMLLDAIGSVKRARSISGL